LSYCFIIGIDWNAVEVVDDYCVQLELLQSECNAKENSISELNRQLTENSAKLDCVQQEFGMH